VSFADDLHVVDVLDRAADAGDDQRVIIGDQHADTCRLGIAGGGDYGQVLQRCGHS
jgi:hypothetical protein